ncbi:MAG: tetratricopeptide repeat protein [Turneriella sp.]
MRSITIWVGAIVFTIGAGVFLIEREYISGNKAAKVRLEQGKLQLERFDEDGLRKGIDDLTAVVAQFPESVHAREARYYLAEAYERLGMRDVALGKYKKLLEMQMPDELRTRARFKIAKLQIMRNYSDEGMNQLLQLLNSTADKQLRCEIYLEIAKYYHRKGFGKDARRNFENALTENPDNREARAALGYTADADYKNSVALHGILDKDEPQPAAKKEDSKPAEPAVAKKYDVSAGVQAFTVGDYQRAVRLLTPAANSAGRESEEALYYLGNAYLKLKQYRNAVHFLNKAVSNKFTERDEASYIKKGEALYLNNQYSRAQRVFSFVRSHYPNGKYAQIAQDWETETRRMLGEKGGGNMPVIGDDDDDDDEDSDVLGGVAMAGDEAAPRPKRNAERRSEEITLEDDAEVTP